MLENHGFTALDHQEFKPEEDLKDCLDAAVSKLEDIGRENYFKYYCYRLYELVMPCSDFYLRAYVLVIFGNSNGSSNYEHTKY